MSEAPRKRRRVARFVSEVDRRLIAEGLPPSWEDRVRPEDTRPGSMADSPDRGDGANDARLLANVPPHAQARASGSRLPPTGAPRPGARRRWRRRE